MKKIQRIIGVVILIMGTAVLNGCTGKPKHEIQAVFDEYLAIYPTENVMDLFDKFDADFSISSRDNGEEEIEESFIEGIHLQFNIEDRKAYGYYTKTRHWNDEKDFSQWEIIFEIPVMYDEKGYHIKEGVEVTVEQREKIMNFKFKFQYLNFQPEITTKYKKTDARYNSNAAIYGIDYILKNTDENFKKLVKENSDEDIIEDTLHLEILMMQMDNGASIRFRYRDKDEKKTHIKYTESISHNLKTTKFRDEYLENGEVE